MENEIIRPKLLTRQYEIIEQDVIRLYLELGISAPINPFMIAKRLGFVVECFSQHERKDIVYDLIKRQKDGFSYYNPNISKYYILLNDLRPMCQGRKYFTIMHEIGHIRLGHKTDSALAEKMANYYAAYALVPSPLVEYYQAYGTGDIVKKFGVTRACAYYCYGRFEKWAAYSHKKEYEKEFLKQYKKVY